ncbi:flagellar motor protein MotD [Azospira restricta]|uniref:Flagellar motor protein MotD n=1 Tax=Azospira restricta TaxID=404405 RepID=A0A974SRY5_9RHOO|nr:flagellar motor protein MotD [Azospira restricta]QRJ65446.1 flagellar motor protein MotD [Azospira restricta]
MARRKRPEEHDNHERWLVSYADFITLLFAFFVVMYALSSINEGKYKILSNSLTQAFRNVTVNASGQVIIPQAAMPTPPSVVAPPKPSQADAAKQKQRERMRNMAKDIMEALAPLVREGKVRLLETSRGVTIEIADSALFAVGQAVLNTESSRALRAVADVIATADFPVTIEGHTDNVPIKTVQFPSNWELSAVRATTVLRIFAEAGVPADRLTAIGYGETRPVESNETIEGRARNRRVSIQIDSALPEKPTEVPVEIPTNAAVRP